MGSVGRVTALKTESYEFRVPPEQSFSMNIEKKALRLAALFAFKSPCSLMG